MSPPRRVLHVIPSVSHAHGGPSRAIRLMELTLANSAWQCVTATTDDDGPGRHLLSELNRPVTEGPATRWYFRKSTEFYKVSVSLVPWLAREVRHFDVVHIHALFSFSSVAAAWAARLARVPYVIRPLGTLASYGINHRRPWLKRLSLAWLEGPALRHAAAVHFTSEEERREAEQTGIPMRGVVIPLGIDATPHVDSDLLRARFPQVNGARFLLYLSRLDPKKNVEGLLRAFSLLHRDWPDLKLLVAGDGAPAYVAGLKGLADELDLRERVVWTGHIDGDLKASALAGAKLFVLPSFSENFGIAAAEALMAGLPCVLGQGVAIAQDVVDAGAGVAVPPEPAAIAAGLQQVLADEAGRVAMGAAALRLAQEKYSAQAMGTKLVALYSEILNR